MKRRKIKKAVKRLVNLPGGVNFFRYGFNKIRHFEGKLLKSVKVAHPSTIMLEVTNHCNLHCITCPREYRYGTEMDKGNMDLGLFKRLVDEAYPYVDSIGLTGMGETLLYPYLPEALNYIKGKNSGIITSISTNATLPGCVETIEGVKYNLDTLQISIDGIGEVYNNIRKNGDYDLFIENVRSINGVMDDADTDITLNMVIVKENYHQMSEMIDLAADMGIRNLTFTVFNLASVTGIDAGYYAFFRSAEFRKAYEEAKSTAQNYPDLDVSFWDVDQQNGFRGCPFPWTHFYVAWNGEVPPCCAKPFPRELSFGNVQNQPLIKVLNTKAFRNFRTLSLKNQAPGFCEKCHFTSFS